MSLETAGENPQLRQQISAAFAHWQHAIAMVIEQAVTQKELPTNTDSESLAGFVLNGWEGHSCVRRRKKATRRLRFSYATSSMGC
ncbi:TetR family transcriptional regulator C-terminal domain-containing protein [Edaphobacter sp. HDX4]